MGTAVWLFGALVGMQTRSNGFVLGGMPLTYAELEKRTGFDARKIERWLAVLRVERYVEVTHTTYRRMRIRVLNQKKFKTKQSTLDFSYPPKMADNDPALSAKNGGNDPTKMADNAHKNGGFNKSRSMSSNETPDRESSALPGFDRFYAAYPRKIDEMRARFEWAKNPLLEMHVDEVMVGLAKWAVSQQWQDEQFIPHPETFIRKRRWEVEPPKERPNGHESFAERRARESEDALSEVSARARAVVSKVARQLPNTRGD